MRDESITALFLVRDERAISEAKRKYGAYCFTVAKNVLGSEEDAEECVSSALLAAWESIPPKRPERLGVFLARIARNIAFNRYKAENRQKRGGGEAALVLDELTECVPGGGDPASETEYEELKRSVNAFLCGLPERERGIFIRRCFNAEPVRAVAKAFGVSEGAVMTSLSRTRKKLRQHLETEGFINE